LHFDSWLSPQGRRQGSGEWPRPSTVLQIGVAQPPER
jgi:hypothetical protein